MKDLRGLVWIVVPQLLGCQASPGTRELGPALLGAPTSQAKRLCLEPRATGPSLPVFALTSSALFHSTDRGESWRRVTPERPPWFELTDVAVDHRSGTVFLAGITYHRSESEEKGELRGALYVSTDRVRWSPIGSGFERNAYCVLVQPDESDALLMGTGRGLLRTLDGGNTWRACTGELDASRIESLAVDQRNSVLYVGSDTGLFRSLDRGETWSRVNLKIPTVDYDTGREYEREPAVWAILVHPHHNGTLFVATDDGVYRSTDDGASWEYANAGIAGTLSENRNVSSLVCDPVAPATLYAGSTTGLFRSNDLGKSWHPAGDDLASMSIHSLAIDPGPPWILYAGTDEGVYRLLREGPDSENRPPQPPKDAAERSCRAMDLLEELDGEDLMTWTKHVLAEHPAVQDEVVRRLAEVLLREFRADKDASPQASPQHPVEAEALDRLLARSAAGPTSAELLLEMGVHQTLHAGHGAPEDLANSGPQGIPVAIRLRTDRHAYVQTVLGHSLVELSDLVRASKQEVLQDYRRALLEGLGRASPVEVPYYQGFLSLLGEPADLDAVFNALNSTEPADLAFVHQWAAKLLPELRASIYGPEGAALRNAILAHTREGAGLVAWQELGAKLRQWLATNRCRIHHDPVGRRYVLGPP